MIRVGSLQQCDKSLLAYAKELSAIFSELDHYRPPAHDSVDREYILADRVYRLLTGLRLDFKNVRSQSCHRESPLSFEDAISQLIGEESQLQEMNGSSESSAYAVTTLVGITID